MPTPLIALRLDTEHRTLLKACVTKEKLSKSDILRRALRMYAKSLGVRVKKSKRGTGKVAPKKRRPRKAVRRLSSKRGTKKTRRKR